MPDVAKVVIWPAEDDVLRKLQPLVIEIQHLGVGDQHLRYAGHISVCPFGKDAPLIRNDLFKERHGHLLARLIILATFTHGVDILIFPIGLHAVFPVFVDVLFIDRIVPRFPRIFAIPLRASDIVAQHRFDVRGAHDNGIVIRHNLVLLVTVEGDCTTIAIVHGWPEMVGSEAQQQFKNLGVCPGTESVSLFRREILHRPGAESPHLIIDEDAAIFDRRWSDAQPLRRNIKRLAMKGCHIRPPVPRRDADALGEFINPVGGTAAVTAGNHQRLLHARQRIGHPHNDIRLPQPLHVLHINLVLLDQAINKRTLAQCTHQHDLFRKLV